MRYKILKSGLLILTLLTLLVSCDKDFNEIGANIIGDEHFGFELYDGATVNAFSQATSSVQSNNLAINSLGIYNNPVFGKTKAGFVTQLQMASPNPTFDPAYFVSMDSVVLTVPYFSHVTSTDASGSKYALDSINGSGPINLKVFESGYYLNDYDPLTNFQEYQSYFTSQESVFNSHKIGSFLNNSDKAENTEFIPSPKQFVVYKRNDSLGLIKSSNNIDKTLSPRMSLHLDKNYFYSKIIKAPSGKLMNNSVFKDYFKGLYFQVDHAANNSDNGTLMRLNFSKGDVTLYYTEYQGFNDPDTKKDPIKFDHDKDPKTPDVPKLVIKSYVLNLQGNTVNLVEHDATGTNYADISDPKRLYVKGSAGGSAAIIDLFGPDLHGKDGVTGEPNGVADELDVIRNNGWLINEANLTFYIDQDAMKSLPNDPKDDADGISEHGEPQRVFLFDVNNRTPLYDFVTDNTKGTNSKLDKMVLGGMIETENINGKQRGRRYKVRLTNHIRNLVKNADSTNVRLGLVVTEAIGLTGNSKLQTPVDIPYPIKSKNARVFDRVPSASVMNPLGTVLYGSTDQGSSEENKKRLKLEIYYTKPKK